MIGPHAISVLALACAVALPADSDHVTFTGSRRTLWLDRSEVIAFHLPAAAERDRVLEAAVEDPNLVEIVRPAQVLAGRDIGFLRVRSREVGETALRVGDARIALRVAATPRSAPVNGFTPRIVAPVGGAAVWGRFEVGIEVPVGSARAPRGACELRLSITDGPELEPARLLPDDGGLVLRATFQVDADALPVGALVLTASALDPRGAREASDPLRLTVVRPAAQDLLSGECEDLAQTARPEGWDARLPSVGSHPDASAGAHVLSRQPDPVWFFPVEVPADGRYQLCVRARGDAAQGAFPSIGLCVDAPARAVTATRLFDHAWQRVPVGTPVRLTAGEHRLAVRFLNDVQISDTIDRNLDLDRYELARVEEALDEVGGSAGMTMMSASGSGDGTAGWDAGTWVAFDRPLDGLGVNGVLSLTAHCRWRDHGTTPAPRVELLVNGAPFDVQQAGRPLFEVGPGALRTGENTLQLVARHADGRRAESPVQRVHLEQPVAGSPRRIRRFSFLDEGWSDSVGPLLDGRGQEVGQRVAQTQGRATLELTLPQGLAGEFECLLDARGPNPPHAAQVRASLRSAAGEHALDPLEVNNWWRERPLGRLQLEPGPKTLVLAVDCQAATDAGDPVGLHLRALRLVEPWAGPDRTPPRVRLLYPAAGHVAHGWDGVVARAADDRGLQMADVLLDGRPLGVYSAAPSSLGDLFLPLPLRDVAPGEHTLAVRVRDEAGNRGESQPVVFEVSAGAPAAPGTFARAVRLLDRFAYGPDPAELAELLTLGEQDWLRRALQEPGAGDEAVLGFVRALRGEDISYNLDRSVLVHAMRTPNPAHLRCALFVQNHFSTWVGKTGVPAEWYEHLLFADLGSAPFGELLAASATSPVMNWYLDQHQSFASRLNENYAREILELHTLGVDGGYTQAEVTELAGLLSGLTLSRETPRDGRGDALGINLRFAPHLGDGRPRELLGLRFEATPPAARRDRLRLALELLAAHPSTARFVARKLAQHYVNVPAPPDLVDELALCFTEEGGDLRALLPAIAAHPSFWASPRADRLSNPFEFGVRLARVTGMPQTDWAVREFLQRSGMGICDRVTPDGYPEEDAAWVDTNAVLQRWRLPETVRWATRTLVPDGLRNDRSTDVPAWCQRVVDVAALRLTGRTLGPESNAAAITFLADSQGPTWQRVDEAAILVCRLPEASLK